MAYDELQKLVADEKISAIPIDDGISTMYCDKHMDLEQSDKWEYIPKKDKSDCVKNYKWIVLTNEQMKQNKLQSTIINYNQPLEFWRQRNFPWRLMCRSDQGVF